MLFRSDRVAAQYLAPAKPGAAKNETMQKEPNKLYHSIKEAEHLLHEAIRFFISLVDKRLEEPISTLSEGEETILECMFQARFGEPMFEWLEFELA